MADVIAEFLVALGYKVDATQQKKFDNALEGNVKNIGKVTAAAGLMAVGIAKAVATISNQLENLYYQSRLGGSSASLFKGFTYGASQIGVSAQAAAGAVQNLMTAIRTNPGSESLLNSYGVQTRDAKNNLLDGTKIMTNMVSKLKTLPFFVANQIAGVFGTDANTLFNFEEGLDKLNEQQAEFARRAKEGGVNLDASAESALKLNTAIRSAAAGAELLGVQIFDKIAPGLTWALEKASKLEDVLLGEGKRTGGATTTALAVGGGLAGVGAVGGAVAGIPGLAGVGGAAAAAGPVGVAVLGTVGIWEAIRAHPAGEGEDASLRARGIQAVGHGEPGQAAAGAHLGGGVKGGMAAAINFFRSKGFTASAAAGIVANLLAESGFHENSLGDNGQAYGIAQWHPERQAAFAKWAGHDIRGSSLMEQMGFVAHELTTGAYSKAGAAANAAGSAYDAGSLLSQQYERPADKFGQATLRGNMANQLAAAVTVNQTNTFNINGGDAQATADAVTANQKRVNGDMVRNLGGSVN